MLGEFGNTILYYITISEYTHPHTSYGNGASCKVLYNLTWLININYAITS